MKINSLPEAIYEAACRFNLLNQKDNYTCKRITDGVSSDIWYVKTNENFEFCIKRALDKLTVKEDWFAPTNRSNFEAMYFKFCKKVDPIYFPTLLGHDDKNYILAMEWYTPSKHELWKKKLLKSNLVESDFINISNILLKKHSFFHKKHQINQPLYPQMYILRQQYI